MRKAEILNLEWDQVNLEEGFIRIEAQRSKNRKIRVILHDNSIKEVFYKLHYSRNGSQFIFYLYSVKTLKKTKFSQLVPLKCHEQILEGGDAVPLKILKPGKRLYASTEDGEHF